MDLIWFINYAIKYELHQIAQQNTEYQFSTHNNTAQKHKAILSNLNLILAAHKNTTVNYHHCT